MSYPQGPPGSPGYPPAQQPTQFTAPTQQFVKAEPAHAAHWRAESAADVSDCRGRGARPGGIPVQLRAAVHIGADFFAPTLLDLGVVAAVAAGLTAGVSLLPKQKALPALVAVLSVLAFPAGDRCILQGAGRRLDRLGAVPDHRVHGDPGDRRGGCALVRCGRHHPARSEAAVRPAVRPVRRPRRAVLRTAAARWPSATPAAGPCGSTRRPTAVATRAAGRPTYAGGQQSGPRPRRPDSPPTASRRPIP